MRTKTAGREPILSKSKYLYGLQCEKKLWLAAHEPEQAAKPSPFRKMVLSRGTDIGERARQLSPDGLLIKSPYYDIEGALQETERALEKGYEVLFEAAFLYKHLFCRVDILQLDQENTWKIIEVKSTLDVQTIQLPDAAVQKYIVEGAGLTVQSTNIMHLNRTCRYPDLSDLFVVEAVDDVIREETAIIPDAAKTFLAVLDAKNKPQVQIGDQCRDPYECAFIGYCWKNVPAPSIFNIRRLNRDRRKDLLGQNILGALDIPENYPLSAQERIQVEMYRSRKTDIDSAAVKKAIDALAFPLYFLDFETDNPAIPRYEGMAPYEQVPFQYSLHILREDGALEHREYLHTKRTDPRSPLAEHLSKDLEEIKNGGRVIAYYAVFEKNVLLGLTKMFPDIAETLLASVKRLWDLLDIFKKHYRHPGFLGSNSLKSVLPVLVPEMDYKSLDVQNGSEAQLAWNALLDPAVPEPERNRTETALREYCRQDTLAMVRIYEALKGL